jgi:Putative prokaryotic signal transducing protein
VGDFVVLETVSTEQEASLICSILQSEGIQCVARPTNFAVGMTDGLPNSGPREIVVLSEDVGRARTVLELQRR